MNKVVIVVLIFTVFGNSFSERKEFEIIYRNYSKLSKIPLEKLIDDRKEFMGQFDKADFRSKNFDKFMRNKKKIDNYKTLADNYLFWDKHQANYGYIYWDQNKAIYKFTYWNGSTNNGRFDGSIVDFFYEPANKITTSLKCEVTLNTEAKIYVYKYTLENTEKSRQDIRDFYLFSNPDYVVDGKINSDLYWRFSKVKRKGYEKCAFGFNDNYLEENILTPGSTEEIFLTSEYLPIVVDCYMAGISHKFKTPSEMGPGVSPAGKEGIKGKTIGPGILEISKDGINEYLKDIFDASLEWGWIEKEEYNMINKKYLSSKEILTKQSFTKLSKDISSFEDRKIIEPEIKALLEHVKIKFYQ